MWSLWHISAEVKVKRLNPAKQQKKHWGKNPMQSQCYKNHHVLQPSNNSKSMGMKMARRWRRKRDLRQWLTFGPLSQSSQLSGSCVQNHGSQHRRFRGCHGDDLESCQSVKGSAWFTQGSTHWHASLDDFYLNILVSGSPTFTPGTCGCSILAVRF